MNGFSKACLVIITLLLTVIALRPVVSQQPVLAASHHYQSLVVSTRDDVVQVQKELDKHLAEERELVGPVNTERIFLLLFRKGAR
jgi:hypothetical protein